MRGGGRGGPGGPRSRDDFHVNPRQNFGDGEYQDPPQSRFYGDNNYGGGYNGSHYNDFAE